MLLLSQDYDVYICALFMEFQTKTSTRQKCFFTVLENLNIYKMIFEEFIS